MRLFVVTEEGFQCLQPGSGACLCKIEAFFLLGERKGMKEKGGREWDDKMGGKKGGGACFKERPPALCLRFPSVCKWEATYTETLRIVCTRMLISIVIMHAEKTYTHTFLGAKGR